MKRLFVLFFILLTFFITVPNIKQVYAVEDNSPDVVKELFGATGVGDVPGVTCGDATNDEAKKCCNIKNINTDIKINDPRFFCLDFGPFHGPCASSLPVDAFEKFIGASSIPKQLEDLKAIAKSTEGCIVGKPDNPGSPNCTCKATALSTLCSKYFTKSPKEMSQCLECTSSNKAIWTGLGCIKVSAAGFAGSLLSLGLVFAGAAALLCIIYSAFLLQTSAGNPERVKKAREYLTSCIIGFLLIIFSVFILRLIGVNIIKIPGFGG